MFLWKHLFFTMSSRTVCVPCAESLPQQPALDQSQEPNHPSVLPAGGHLSRSCRRKLEPLQQGCTSELRAPGLPRDIGFQFPFCISWSQPTHIREDEQVFAEFPPATAPLRVNSQQVTQQGTPMWHWPQQSCEFTGRLPQSTGVRSRTTEDDEGPKATLPGEDPQHTQEGETGWGQQHAQGRCRVAQPERLQTNQAPQNPSRRTSGTP